MQTVAELSRTSALNVVPSRDNRLPAGNSFNSLGNVAHTVSVLSSS
jgi:hypothetical protein